MKKSPGLSKLLPYENDESHWALTNNKCNRILFFLSPCPDLCLAAALPLSSSGSSLDLMGLTFALMSTMSCKALLRHILPPSQAWSIQHSRTLMNIWKASISWTKEMDTLTSVGVTVKGLNTWVHVLFSFFLSQPGHLWGAAEKQPFESINNVWYFHLNKVKEKNASFFF